MALHILALLQRIFLLSSMMLLMVWLIFFFLMIQRLPRSTLFPYTTLFRSQLQPQNAEWALRQLYENYQRAKAAKSLLRVSRALAELDPNNEKLKNNVAFFTLLTDGNVQEIGRAHV